MTWGLDGVEVRFGKTLALDGVDLEVAPGAVTAIVGGDGAGKTTVARTLVGLVPLTAGSVRRPGVVGYQPESSGVWADMTVAENLGFVATAYRLSPAETQRRIAELLEATALGPARHRLARRLSGGMRQKLGVAMALLPLPELLVLDEPTTGLDPLSRLELWRFISAGAAVGRAVLLTTSYLDEAERAATIYALDGGRVLAHGDPHDLRSEVPGAVLVADHPIDAVHRWRRGRMWRVWSPTGDPMAGAEPVAPDLDDVITVAALARRSA